MTKEDIRRKVRAALRKAGVVRFPGTDRIPNFAEAERAARRVCKLPMWKRAAVIKIDADAPQLALRRAALYENKTIYLPVPRLGHERCFIELDPRKLGPSIIARAASLKGALRYGIQVPAHEVMPIDLVICGCVAVTRQGGRVGRGDGLCDLTYALLRGEGRIREYTPILTTVHPLQIVDAHIPMRRHDVPVDFVVTADQVVAAPSLHPRPRALIPEILRRERLPIGPWLLKGTAAPSGRSAP
jgi:5-formyltetrahydrofolate cyclo-ligase